MEIRFKTVLFNHLLYKYILQLSTYENDNGDDREDVSQPADQLVLHTEHVESFEVHFPSYAAALTAGGRRGAMECGPRR